MSVFHIYMDSPLGVLKLTSSAYVLTNLSYVSEKGTDSETIPEILGNARMQLLQYFKGERLLFSLRLNPGGTDFQKKVWSSVEKIDYGRTASYLDIAKNTGSAKNARAVGAANAKNPIPIIIPCHRIIGSSGKLTGYAGGIPRKKWLLQHELQHSNLPDNLFSCVPY